MGVVDARKVVDVIDDDLRAARLQQLCVRLPDAATGAGDDGDATVEPEIAQAANPSKLPSVPPRMAARSSSGTPSNNFGISSRLPRNVPSAWG